MELTNTRRKRCVYRPCPPQSDTSVSYFRFPNDPERAAMWLRACNREDLMFKKTADLYKNHHLCEKHFSANCFSIGSSRKRLFNNVFPTIFTHTSDKNVDLETTTDKLLSTPGPSKRLFVNEQTVQYVENVHCTPGPSKRLVVNNEKTVQYVENVHCTPGPSKRLVVNNEKTVQYVENVHCTPGPSKRLFVNNEQTVQYVENVHCTPGPSKDISSTSGTVPVSPGLVSVGSQCPNSLSATSPRKQILRRKLKAARRCKQKTFSSRSQWTIADFKEICDKFLKKPLADIVKAQAELGSKKPLGRRYDMEYKQFALTLYFLGPRAYAFMAKFLCLPSKRSLQHITEKIVTKPGFFNDAVFKALEIKVQTMIEVDKHCSICIDEMALKSNLFYNLSRDEITGLHDTGAGIKEFVYAQNALVIMVRGLYNNWKQPLAYFFVNSQFAALQLKDAIEKCIAKLFDLGLVVDAIVSDMGSNFIQLSKILGVTDNNSEIELCGKKITLLFDVCHLIKATRNNLLKNIINFNDKQTSWSYIQSFYEQDSKQFYRCAPKLTKAHLFPTNFQKLKVKLATQVLSHTVASGINVYMTLGVISSSAIGTIDFIEKFNNLFDILNSCDANEKDRYKKVFQGESCHIDYFNEMLALVQGAIIYDKEGKNVTGNSKFKKCWVVTFNGLLSLWPKLSAAGFKYMKTRRLNTDCLENFFGSVRQQGGNSFNPTPIQFERAFKKLFCQSYLHTNNMNCKDDLDDLLIQLDPKKIISLGQEIESSQKAISLTDYDYRVEDITVQNPFQYVCGYLIKKSLNVHRCDVCVKFSKDSKDCDER